MAETFRTVYILNNFGRVHAVTDLRHRLIPNMRRREKWLSSLAILGSFIGGLGIILLSIFDTKRHTSLHRVFLLVFIVGVALSAIFTVMEVCLFIPQTYYIEIENLS